MNGRLPRIQCWLVNRRQTKEWRMARGSEGIKQTIDERQDERDNGTCPLSKGKNKE